MDLADGNGGYSKVMLRSHKSLKPVIFVHNLNLGIRKNPLYDLNQHTAEGKQKQGRSQIEYRMDICNLRHGISRSQADHHICKWSYKA